eukprot:gene26940-33592_t
MVQLMLNIYREKNTIADVLQLILKLVIEVRALGQVFAMWRDDEGKPVCQDAFCLHLGANLAVGGKELTKGEWKPHLKWNIGFKTLSPVDWVDQAGDHAHFATLHADFLIPWTLIPFPEWILKLFPVGICHKLVTFRGDDKDWGERVKTTGWGAVDKHFIFFTDLAGLTWNRKAIKSTESETVEVFVGPAIMIFNIPFTIGALKAFVTTTPTEGGSIMRVRTWMDSRVATSYWMKYLAWVITGISASQLQNDIVIMENKIRQKKPILQPFDGPYNRTSELAQQIMVAEEALKLQEEDDEEEAEALGVQNVTTSFEKATIEEVGDNDESLNDQLIA